MCLSHENNINLINKQTMRKFLTLFSLTLFAFTASAHTYVNGFCKDDGCTDIYEPATYSNGYYEIDNGGKLFWFANYVNANHRSISAKLTADIDLENRTWIVICPNTSTFSGEFDGQGHSITNYVAETTGDYSAFIGNHSSEQKSIKNFTLSGTITYTGNGADHKIAGIVANSYGTKIQDVVCNVDINTPNANGSQNVRVAGIVAWTNGHTTIERCTYSGTINGASNKSQMAGIIGLVNGNDVTIANCLYTGTINSENTSTSYVGGILGYINPGQRTGFVCENNLSIGYFNVAKTTYAGVLVGQRNGTGNASFSNNYVLLTHGLTAAQGSGTTTNAISITDETTLTNGTLVDLLDTDNWTQGTNNPIPFHSHDHSYVNGICTVDGCINPYEKAELSSNYYLINNGGKLFWLAQQVNKGNTAYNAKLTADIDLGNRLWTPIGNSTNKYTGTFDGQGYSITNLNINSNTDCGFIGYHNGTNDVKNFSLSGNILYTGKDNAHNIGGVLAYNIGANHVQDIQCSVNITTTYNYGRFGGIAAKAESGPTINRCVYSGTIDGKSATMQIAGIVGWCNTGTCIVNNCLFSGKLISTYLSSGNTAYIGGVYGYSYYALTCTNNLCIGEIQVPQGATKYVGALIGGKRNAGGTFTNNHVKLNGVSNLYGTGYNSVEATIISDADIANLTDGTTLTALGTDNWAQDTGNPVPKAFTCTESNGGTAATITGTICAYNFDVFRNAVKDYATVDMSGANMTSNIADSDVESLLTNNGLVYVPNTTDYCGKNIVNDGICDDFELTEGKPFAPTTGFEASAATYTRTISNAWGTICLPYAVESDDNVTYYTTGTISGDVLTLTSAATVPAGTPAICKFAATGENTIEAYLVNVCTDVAPDTQNDDITLIGTFTNQTILATDVPNAYYISGGKFWHATGTLTVKPFRAYFTTSGAGSNGFSIVIDNDDLTALAGAEAGDTEAVAIYGVDGKKTAALQKGVNIVKLADGKTQKVVVK